LCFGKIAADGLKPLNLYKKWSREHKS
jgi:hypothetical protein